jgi:glucose/mannose-6-phosphate isomerase
MLDDLMLIHERDTADALGIAERQWQQLEYTFETSPPFETDHVSNVICAGMGSSAAAAQIVRSWLSITVPFEIVRDYDIPAYVDSNTLFIAISYSGNTAETVSALEQARARGAQIAVIAAGGRLTEIAHENNYPLLVLPGVEQPRQAVLYTLKALVTLLQQAHLAPDEVTSELVAAVEATKTAVADWQPIVPTARNPAKQLALEVIGKSAVIYAGPKLGPIAYKWKLGFNENAKHLAWWNQLPEFNHNELIGWSKQPIDKLYTVIELRSSLEHPRVQKSFEVAERLLSGVRPNPHVVVVQGTTILEQLLWATVFGDFVTLYTALLNGLNPTPIELVDKFKQGMES